MSRLPRVVAPGLPHHVTQRGNRRQRTFFKEEDYAEYCGLLADACRSCGTQVLAYCLMPNHVHLIMVPVDEFGLRDALGCVFHAKLDTDSTASWTPIPGQAGHLK